MQINCSRTIRYLVVSQLLMLFISSKLFPIEIDSLAPNKLYTLRILDKELRIYQDTSKILVMFELINPSDGLTLAKVLIEKTYDHGWDFNPLFISKGGLAFLLFPTNLVIVNSQESYINIVNMPYSAMMYLVDTTLYFETAQTEPAGIGFDMLNMKKLPRYIKKRPFDIDKAISAKELK